MKRYLAIIGIILVCVLGSRELGYIELTLAHRFYETGNSRHESLDVPRPQPLSRADTQLTHTGRDDTFGKYHVYSNERWDFAWSRWIPLIKTGDSTVTRDYFVTESGMKVSSGHDTATVSLTACGLLSARTYQALVTASDRKRFLEQVEKDMQPSPENEAR